MKNYLNKTPSFCLIFFTNLGLIDLLKTLYISWAISNDELQPLSNLVLIVK